jgi:hypothetical protein
MIFSKESEDVQASSLQDYVCQLIEKNSEWNGIRGQALALQNEIEAVNEKQVTYRFH